MSEQKEHVYELTPTQLAEKLKSQPNTRLIDIREQDEWEYCHIDGAEWMPMQSVPSRLAELSQDDTLVLYCHHGSRSAFVLNFLHQKGYTDIAHLRGGIDAWARDIDPDMPTY